MPKIELGLIITLEALSLRLEPLSLRLQAMSIRLEPRPNRDYGAVRSEFHKLDFIR